MYIFRILTMGLLVNLNSLKVSSQCLSSNDDLSLATTFDLAHILNFDLTLFRTLVLSRKGEVNLHSSSTTENLGGRPSVFNKSGKPALQPSLSSALPSYQPSFSKIKQTRGKRGIYKFSKGSKIRDNNRRYHLLLDSESLEDSGNNLRARALSNEQPSPVENQQIQTDIAFDQVNQQIPTESLFDQVNQQIPTESSFDHVNHQIPAKSSFGQVNQQIPGKHKFNQLSSVPNSHNQPLLPWNRIRNNLPYSIENFFFSPYSIWNALVLAYFGAEGKTENQLRQVLRVSDKLSTFRKWRKLEYLYQMRSQLGSNNTFVLANRIFFDDSVILRRCMGMILHNEIQTIDFGHPSDAAKIINDFIKDMTHGHLQHMISPQDVENALMVLVNAAYFKGRWETVFNPENTHSTTFYRSPYDPVNVEMMTVTDTFLYGMDDTLRVEHLILPYENSEISMHILLPMEFQAGAVDDVILGLDAAALNRILNNTEPLDLTVNFPKFSMEHTMGDDLMTALHTMGLQDMFDPTTANFGHFSFKKRLNLDSSIHRAFVEVSEEGTTAGAATVFVSTKMGGDSSFTCDVPFVFFIRDKQTSNILFMGVMRNPEEALSSSSSKRSSSNKPNSSSHRSSSTGPISVFDDIQQKTF